MRSGKSFHGPQCSHPADKVVLRPKHQECRYCGTKWVVPLTVADAMTVPEVLALVDAIHQCAPGLGKRHAVRVALAPFLAAMEGKS